MLNFEIGQYKIILTDDDKGKSAFIIKDTGEGIELSQEKFVTECVSFFDKLFSENL